MSSFSIKTSEERVRILAHALWLEEGRPDGRAEAHWFKALERVNTEAGDIPAASQAAADLPDAKTPVKRKAPAAAAAKKSPAKRTKA